MLYNDRIYGEIEINKPVVLELINCPNLQRLKEVDPAGYSPPYFPGEQRTRFNHSLGVFILLKKYNAPLEEQIAGLIHDVSHAAFSHCIDFVLETGSEQEQSHQDKIWKNFIKQSTVPLIFQKYNLNLEYILHTENFPLLEKELPNLCADRIDYSLRDATALGCVDDITMQYFLNNLSAENQVWFFKDFQSAKRYADFFLGLNGKYYSDIISAVMYRTVGDYLKYALQMKYITKDDLYTTDKIVLEKIAPHLENDEQLRLFWNRMNLKIGYKNDPQNYDARVFCKSRIVDPLCRHNSELKKVSEIDTHWAQIVAQESKPKEYFIKFDA